MKATDLTIEVKAKLTVDEKTAKACLKFVEIFTNETGRNVIASKKENGEISFQFEEVRV